jgi:hypothetical protein
MPRMFAGLPRPKSKEPAGAVLRESTQRPPVVAPKATELLVAPLMIPRSVPVTLPEVMRHIFPVAVTHLHGGTTPRSNNNPVLHFPILCHRDGTSFEILPDSGTDQTGYFDFFQFGKLGEQEFEVCYSSSLGAHGRLLMDFKRRKAHWHWLPAGSALDARGANMENLEIRSSGLLPPGCGIRSATLPHVEKFENNTLHFSTKTPPLKLNDEFCSLVVGEIVGSGMLFSLKDAQAVFRYDQRLFQHFFISLTHPKKMQGKIYYGGKTRIFHNLGGSVESEVVDLHQSLLRVLFGVGNKSLLEELEIQGQADVFVGFKELEEYVVRTRTSLTTALLADSERLTPAAKEEALNDFMRCADLISYFAGKLEDAEERAFLRCQCLFGKSSVCVERDDSAGAQALVEQLLATAAKMIDPARRHDLHTFLEGAGWKVRFEEIFAGPTS